MNNTDYKTEAQRLADIFLRETFSEIRARRKLLEKLTAVKAGQKQEMIDEKGRDRKDHA